MFNKSLSTGEKAPICSICLIPQCTCSHCGLLQVKTVMQLNAEVGKASRSKARVFGTPAINDPTPHFKVRNTEAGQSVHPRLEANSHTESGCTTESYFLHKSKPKGNQAKQVYPRCMVINTAFHHHLPRFAQRVLRKHTFRREYLPSHRAMSNANTLAADCPN